MTTGRLMTLCLLALAVAPIFCGGRILLGSETLRGAVHRHGNSRRDANCQPRHKPGTCPLLTSSVLGVLCTSDDACPTNQICCTSVCRTPIDYPCLSLADYVYPYHPNEVFVSCGPNAGDVEQWAPDFYESHGEIFRSCTEPIPAAYDCY